jgi:pimeloyl-ACP methyl ester carboxylesterase
VVLFASPFTELANLAEEELLRLADRHRGPVRVLAHSFGAVLALHLAMRQPEAIGSVILLAPVSDIGGAFARLALRLCDRPADRERLLAAHAQYLLACDDYAAFSGLAQTVLATQDFIDVYWAPGSTSRCDAFKTLLANESLFDHGTFEAITRDLCRQPPLNITTRIVGPVHVVLGRHDPLVDPDTEYPIWGAYFPTATPHLIETGHFPHLEADASEWFR